MANIKDKALSLWVYFLNHLCDGEQWQYALIRALTFLNHLCDGERGIGAAVRDGFFLNHLCDGERHHAR